MKLIGCIDGIEVKFDFYPPNKFIAEIPKKIDGTYIVEFTAIDDAGNKTSYSNIFIKINFNKMNFEILKGLINKEEVENYNYKELSNTFEQSNLIEAISFEKLIQEYSYREVVI
ncbi:MAG: PF13754 domain-containing protein [Clostridium sp.]